MHRTSLKDIVLYEVVGKSASFDNIVIFPAFYEIIPNLRKYESILDFSLNKYMNQNGYHFSEVYPKFYKFYSEFEIINQYDAIWVRAKIPQIFNFYPPFAFGWRYQLLNVPFLAVILSNSNEFPLLHPFICFEENLSAGLEFYEITTPEQCRSIADAFWKLFFTSQELSTFIDVVLGDNYDYDSLVMGNDFVSGYWNGTFYLVYV